MRHCLTWTLARRALFFGLALATAAGFFREAAWWLDLFADFRVQIALAAALLTLGAASVFQRKEVLFGLAVLAINGYAVQPYLTPGPQPAAAMKIISFNVLHRNRNTAEAIDFITRESPDVVVVVEASEIWRRRLTGLAAIYPYQTYGPLDGDPDDDPHMIGLLAKRPWVASGVEHSKLTGRAFAVWARFSEAAAGLTVVGVHLMNPIFRPASHQRTEAGQLASVVTRVKGAVVVAGDFNMTPFSSRFETLLRTAGLTRAGGGLNASWPASIAPFGLPLDHLLVGAGISAASMRTGPRLGSDHLPLIGAFDLGS